jgi:DNA-binding IclR family transcriptional regulator
VGAWTVAAAEAVQAATGGELGGSGSLAAALVTIATFPGERVDALRRALGLSPSGVVRTVDRLVDAGLVERQASPTAPGRRHGELGGARAGAVRAV